MLSRPLLAWSGTGLLLAACASTATLQQTNDDLPMYGQPAIARTEELKKADDEFIKQATAPVGSRETASKVWYAQGDAYVNNGNQSLAIRRFNQAWLLNPNSYQPYWGFGRVTLSRGKVDEAIGYFEKAKRMCDDPYQKVALLSDAGVAYATKADKTDKSNAAERAHLFGVAYDQYRESIQMDPKYPNSWHNWVSTLWLEGRYADAWEKVSEGRSKAGQEFSERFLKNLSEKMPEPK
jgi:tetratricopeptide (TPR) repeat protein